MNAYEQLLAAADQVSEDSLEWNGIVERLREEKEILERSLAADRKGCQELAKQLARACHRIRQLEAEQAVEPMADPMLRVAPEGAPGAPPVLQRASHVCARLRHLTYQFEEYQKANDWQAGKLKVQDETLRRRADQIFACDEQIEVLKQQVADQKMINASQANEIRDLRAHVCKLQHGKKYTFIKV
jgi:hypothetical protein